MIILWIILAIIALPVLVILLGSIRVRIVYRDRLKVQVGTCGINVTVLSDKKKKEKKHPPLKACKHPERVLKKELKKQERARVKAAKKAEERRRKAALKKAKKKAQKAQKVQQASKPKVPTPNVKENLDMILALLKKLYRVTRGSIHVHFRKMHIAVATGDAAKTAIRYGIIVQSASYLLNFVEETFTHLKRDFGDMTVYPDYTSSKTKVDLDIVCRIRILKLISIGISMLLAFLGERAKAKKKAVLRARKKAEEAAALNEKAN